MVEGKLKVTNIQLNLNTNREGFNDINVYIYLKATYKQQNRTKYIRYNLSVPDQSSKFFAQLREIDDGVHKNQPLLDQIINIKGIERKARLTSEGGNQFEFKVIEEPSDDDFDSSDDWAVDETPMSEPRIDDDDVDLFSL